MKTATPRRWVVVGGVGISALIFAVLLSIIDANYGLADAHDARTVILVAVVAGLFALQFAFYNIRITNDKIAVRSGAIPIPTISLDMNDVEHAEYADKISPMRYGGWGLRLQPNGRNLILNSGPAPLVYMANGNEHVITMTGAREAAGVINGVLKQSHNQGAS